MKNESAAQYLSKLGLDELEFIKGKYCRPDMRLACEKQFGMAFDIRDVEIAIQDKLDLLLINGEDVMKPDSDLFKDKRTEEDDKIVW